MIADFFLVSTVSLKIRNIVILTVFISGVLNQWSVLLIEVSGK